MRLSHKIHFFLPINGIFDSPSGECLGTILDISYTFLSTTKSSIIHFSQRKYLLPFAFLLQQIFLLQPSVYSCVGCKNSSICQLLKSFRSSTTIHPKSLRSIWQFWSFGFASFSVFQRQIKKVFKDIGACFGFDLLRVCACSRIGLDRLLYIYIYIYIYFVLIFVWG